MHNHSFWSGQIVYTNSRFTDREFLNQPTVSLDITGESIEEGAQIAVTCRVEGTEINEVDHL